MSAYSNSMEQSFSSAFSLQESAWEENEVTEAPLSFLQRHSQLCPRKKRSGYSIKISISGKFASPHVEIVKELPAAPSKIGSAASKPRMTELQSSQAVELFDYLLKSGTSRKDALRMLGPLASAITKYRYSFSVNEARWFEKKILGDLRDIAFMSPNRS